MAGRFGARTAALVAAVTNPEWEPGPDEHEQYREHVPASLEASPWAQVIKASDLTDNAVGIIHTTGRSWPAGREVRPAGARAAGAHPAPGHPLENNVKDMIAAQLDAALGRVASPGSVPW